MREGKQSESLVVRRADEPAVRREALLLDEPLALVRLLDGEEHAAHVLRDRLLWHDHVAVAAALAARRRGDERVRLRRQDAARDAVHVVVAERAGPADAQQPVPHGHLGRPDVGVRRPRALALRARRRRVLYGDLVAQGIGVAAAHFVVVLLVLVRLPLLRRLAVQIFHVLVVVAVLDVMQARELGALVVARVPAERAPALRMDLQRADHLRVVREVADQLHAVVLHFLGEDVVELGRRGQKLAPELHQPIHVRLQNDPISILKHSAGFNRAYFESVQVLCEGRQVEVVDDDQVSSGRADDHLVGVGRDAAPHQPGRVENFLVDETLLRVRVDVPRENAAVEAGGDEQALLRRVLDVLHPVQVAVQAPDLRFQLSRVPDGDRRVVGAGGEHLICDEPWAAERKLFSQT